MPSPQSLKADTVEQLARNLASIVLHDPAWEGRLEGLCETLHRAAAHIKPMGIMAAVVRRAETILRQISAADPVTVGRLYFDLLPREVTHPLTAAVVRALSDRDTVLAMLRDAGVSARLLKDDSGITFIILDGLDRARDLSEGMKQAILEAMTAEAPPPRGGLHAVH